PCPGWDLATLLDHVSDSVAVLYEAIATGVAGTAPPGRRGPGPVARLRAEAARLLGACAAAGPAERRIAIWDRQLSASAVALMGSIEISVHGWDISVACGARRPGLFAAPVRLPAPACPGDQLVAFLSRRPHPPDTSAPGRTSRSGLNTAEDSSGWFVWFGRESGPWNVSLAVEAPVAALAAPPRDGEPALLPAVALSQRGPGSLKAEPYDVRASVTVDVGEE